MQLLFNFFPKSLKWDTNKKLKAFLKEKNLGFAVESWMLYIGNGVDLLKRYYNSAIKSSISKCVDFNEKGKVMALIFTIESFFPIFMSQVVQ